LELLTPGGSAATVPLVTDWSANPTPLRAR
jgi:hypothetical protein